MSLILGILTVRRTGSKELITLAEVSRMSYLISSLVNGLNASTLVDNGLLATREVEVRPLE